MDKIKQLYDSFLSNNIISSNTDFEAFKSANEEQLKSLYDVAVKNKVLSSATDFNMFSSAWGLKKKDELQVTSPTAPTESVTEAETTPILSEPSQKRIEGIQEYFKRRDSSSKDIEGDENISAAIDAGVITDNDLILAGYKKPDKISTLSQPTQREVDQAKIKISAFAKKTPEEIDFFIEQNKLNTPFAYKEYATDDSFVNDIYDSNKLKDKNIDPEDFEGFLERKGFKRDFLDKQKRGLFERTFGAVVDPALAYETEKMRMLNLYIAEQFNRDISFQKLEEQKQTGVNPDYTYKKFQFKPSESNIDINKVSEYIEDEMPLLTQKLKEVDDKNRKLYNDYKNGDIGVDDFIAETGRQGWEGIDARLQSLSASTYGALGAIGIDYFSNVADATRLQMEQEELLSGDNLSYAYASGREVEHKGINYMVSENGQIYDVDDKINATYLLSEDDRTSVQSKAIEKGRDTYSFSGRGVAYQSANVIGDMMVQIALTRAVGSGLSSSGAISTELGVLSKTKGLLKSIPMSRSMSSAVLAQATMGLSSGYEDTLKLAKEAGLNEAESIELAQSAAIQMGALYAITAPISPQTKATDKIFGGINKSVIKEAVDAYINKGAKGFFDTFKKYGLKASELSEEGLKELFQENVQQAGEMLIVNKDINEQAQLEIKKDTITMDDFINTSILSFIAGGMMPGAGSAINSSKKRLRKMMGYEGIDRLKALSHLSKNENKVKGLLTSQVSKGVYTQEQADNLISEISTYKNGIGKIPSNISPDKALEVVSDIEQISKLENKKKTLDPAFHEDIDNEIAKIRESIKEKTKQDAIVREPSIEETEEVIVYRGTALGNRSDKDGVTYVTPNRDYASFYESRTEKPQNIALEELEKLKKPTRGETVPINIETETASLLSLNDLGYNFTSLNEARARLDEIGKKQKPTVDEQKEATDIASELSESYDTQEQLDAKYESELAEYNRRKAELEAQAVDYLSPRTLTGNSLSLGIDFSNDSPRQIFEKLKALGIAKEFKGGNFLDGYHSDLVAYAKENNIDYYKGIVGGVQGSLNEKPQEIIVINNESLSKDTDQTVTEETKPEIQDETKQQAGDRAGSDTSRKNTPLEGAPIIQGATGPDANLVEVAEKYAADNGIDLKRQSEYVAVDEERAKRIADAYEQMANDPQNPKVKEAYEDLIRQTKAQYDALVDAGYEFTFFDDQTDPYNGNPYNAMRDLRSNKKMAVYGTFAGYGTEGITDSEVENNPMLADTGLRWKDQNGNEQIVTANDLFRAVHDAFGHGLEGSGFRARGEENAWQAHVRLFKGPAVAALTSETRGQNSWLNYGPFGEANRTAKVGDTVFAEQKVGLMPEFTWKEGLAPDVKAETGIDKLRQQFGRKSFPTDGDRVNTQQDKLAIERQAQNAIKALAKLFPDVKINLYYDEANYHQAIGVEDFSAGTYSDNVISINLTRASKSTVAHEVFHAMLAKSLKSDKAIQDLTKRFVESLSKTQDPNLMGTLIDGVRNIEEYKGVENEEVMAELFGILAGNHKQLKKDTRNLIKRFLDRLAKIFGLKQFTDSEVVNVLNALARSVETGQEITDIGVLEQTATEGVLTDKKQIQQRPSIDEAYKYSVDNGISLKETRDFLESEGYTKKEISDYVKKEEKVFEKKGNKILNTIQKIKRKLLSAKAFLPVNVFKALETKNSFIAADVRAAERTAKKLRRLMKNQPDSMYEQVDNLMRGKEHKGIPENIQVLAATMRQHLDSMSEALIKSGAVKAEESIQNIKDNMGIYMNRSYQLFDNKNWKENVSEQIIDEAKQYLKNNFKVDNVEELAKENNVTVDEYINTRVNQIVDDILNSNEANEFVSVATQGSKNLKVLKQRKEIPPQIRALMGEYTDPAYNYVVSVAKISSIVQNQKFLEKVKDIGEGVFMFKESDINRPIGDERYVRLSAEGNESLSPIDGYFMPKEMAEQFKKGIKILDIKSKDFERIYSYWLTAVGSVKYAKTILSIGTHSKNVLGNLYFMAQNGYLDPKEYNDALKTLRNEFTRGENESLNQKMDEYIRSGIINQSVTLNEVKNMMKGDDSFDIRLSKRIQGKSESIIDKGKQSLKKIGEAAETAYQAEDDFFKIVAYEKEKSDYSKILFNKSYDKLTQDQQDVVKSKVSENVKNILPNYSRVGGLAKGLRGFPVAGTFISFQMEAWRTAYNTIALAADELKSDNPKMRDKGAKRMASIIGFQAIKYGIMYIAQGMLLGDEEDEEDIDVKTIRPFLPSWAKNSDLLITSAGEGKFRYVNMSASDPYGGIVSAINALSRGETVQEGMIQSFLEVAEPILSPDIFLAMTTQLLNNQNSFGAKIYEETDTPFEVGLNISDHIFKVFEPGTITSARKIFKRESSQERFYETVGQFSGFKPHEVEVEKIAFFNLRDLKENKLDPQNKRVSKEKRMLEETKQGLSKLMFDKEFTQLKRDEKVEVEKAMFDKLYETINKTSEKKSRSLKEAHDMFNAATRLGVDPLKISLIMKNLQFRTEDKSKIIFGDSSNQSNTD
jgi:hypothetical protein